MKSFKSIFPFDQTEVAEYRIMSEADIDKALSISEKAFLQWSNKTFAQHGNILKRVGELLIEKKASLAKLITSEMGKVTKEAIAEIEKCAWGCNFYAEHAEQFLQDEIIETNYKKSFVVFQPIGAVLAIMPWNFPFWQVFRFAAPTLMAGNV